jgi:hypothetical protein
VDRESVMSQLGEHEQVYRITQLAKGESKCGGEGECDESARGARAGVPHHPAG